MEKQSKITSTIIKTTNLNGVIEVEKDGIKHQVVTLNCALKENDIANIQTYVSNKELFRANSTLIAAEIKKFKDKVNETAETLNCFVI